MKPITETQFDPAFLTSLEYWWNRKTREQNLDAPCADHADALLAIAQNNKPMFRLISTTRPPAMDGWCDLEKACVLAGLAIALKPAVIVELGVWAGSSLLPMAWGAQTYGGKVIGIDAWQAAASIKDEYSQNVEWWNNQPMHDQMFTRTAEFIRNFELNETIGLVRSKTDDVTPPECAMLHIDGNHAEQAVRDANRYGPKVKLGGVVVCDDIGWMGGSVLRAIDSLEEMGFVERYRPKSGAQWNLMQRVR